MNQLVAVFKNFKRNFIISLQFHLWLRAKRAAPPLQISFPGCLIGVEIKAGPGNDAEKFPAIIKAVGSEHPAAAQVRKGRQLVQNKVPEGVRRVWQFSPPITTGRE